MRPSASRRPASRCALLGPSTQPPRYPEILGLHDPPIRIAEEAFSDNPRLGWVSFVLARRPFDEGRYRAALRSDLIEKPQILFSVFVSFSCRSPVKG